MTLPVKRRTVVITDEAGNPIDSANPLPVDATLEVGDLEIGAVELKDGSSDNRATVDSAGVQSVKEAANVAGTPTHAADITVDATAGGVTLLAANAARKAAIIQNTGTATMRVSIGGTPATNTGFQVAAGGVLRIEAPFCPTGAIKAIREGAVSTTAAPFEVA